MQPKKTVLIVDDDDIVLNVTAEMLSRGGFSVLKTSRPLEALKILDARDDISLVMVDIKMPEMSGTDVFRFLNQERPTLPVVLVSGYATHDLRKGDPEPAGFLRKPFDMKTLIDVVGKVIDHPS